MKEVIKRVALPALTGHTISELITGKALGSVYLLLTVALLLGFSASHARAQDEGSYSIWGDIKIDDSQADTPAPLTLTVILYDERGTITGRQVVTNRGRYRFNNLQRGQYDLVVEGEMGEVTRTRISVFGAIGSDFRQDFEFQWKSKVTEPKPITGIISAADAYERSSANKSLFQKAQKAAEKKKYSEAAMLLRQIVENDKQDFQAWSLLGTIYLADDKPEEAEKAYLTAIQVRPTFGLALLNLGRLRASQKRFAEAIDPLTRAVQAQPQSASANLLLGEAYLQIKKGSKAIPYLNEAAKLGLVEAHLRLAWLYNAAGLKDKAAEEYEEFLKKKPQYPDRKKLEQYISANKKAKSSS
ncbi:MAG: tetratricopeptide repeat protein [Pyrinomonadaceae bacterium]|nr:tetratricopeptide repeat protein [Pyrinomonadaceae bacterium]